MAEEPMSEEERNPCFYYWNSMSQPPMYFYNQRIASSNREVVNVPDQSNVCDDIASFIDLTSDDHDSPDIVPISPDSSNANNNAADDSLSIVYEDIKPPPDLNVEIDPKGDLLVEVLKSHSKPYSGSLMKKVKVGPKSVNIMVTVNSKTPLSSKQPTNQRIRGKIPMSELMAKRNKPCDVEIQSESTSASSSNSMCCGICLDSYSEIEASLKKLVSTSCGHVFCNECIENTMKTYKKCPKCRKKLTKKSYHPLYLS